MKKNSMINSYFPALKHKDFRYFWIGSMVSLIGTWIQNTGQAWLVLTLTNSSFKLGLVSALQFTPVLIFSIFAGALIDNISKRKILLFTQTSFMILAFILSFLVFTNKVQYWHVLVLAVLLGCINTLDMPTRQSFMIELVGKENLLNAIALNSSVFNGARLIGPGISGIMIHYFGFTFCFLLNALSFIPLIYGIHNMNVKENNKIANNKKNILKDVKEGLVYIRKNPIIYRTILLIAIVGTFAMNYSVLIPLQAKMVLNEGSKEYGYLMSSMGAGSFISAVLVAAKSKKGPKKLLLYFSGTIISLFLVGIGFTKSFSVSALFLFIIGIFNILFTTTANSRIQLNVNDEYRGRVMSVYSLVFTGVTPIGSLFTGYISNTFNVSFTFILSGIITTILVWILFIIPYKKIS
ncbi:MFS family permease [Clostridium tetanomorphum]|uniref:MFS transporter n=1 Tax=Clostridium tetanomorphum TaxID=1553 RepID=A0A923J0Q4_CLOTT|nr:MFS transporter [Clostridium tetanomorphum]KAJ51969.1 major facilitator superfamily protein [Clostridium tetanomorphum DSM 665]MBC2396970.1 MFS transporter [Clostridium tetanomorphum]MBP1862889.1 MFS family permease [Clostridium tetanomorphum]NRS87026.1 MFS family permease [Clostridium tetanomorphum]NRZ99188.1 MFS family permease [Clostridium tetanomorphum]